MLNADARSMRRRRRRTVDDERHHSLEEDAPKCYDQNEAAHFHNPADAWPVMVVKSTENIFYIEMFIANGLNLPDN